MKIEISGYRNLLNLILNIDENKINFIFGKSGSGKGSIVKALLKEDPDFNKTINNNIDQRALLDNNLIFEEKASLNFIIRNLENLELQIQG